jgi:GntR family transcriptional repressor for pyruvate dehydrogenase complex
MKIKRTNSFGDPIEKDSVVMLVIERIKKAIINRELKPGDYLPTETEICQSLGASKTSVREAIKMLQALGVLEVRRGSGTRIREQFEGSIIDPLILHLIVQAGPIQEIFDFRKMFEPAYSLMAMERATKEDIEEIRKTIEHFEQAVEKGEQTADDDLDFHRAILNSTHNSFVIRVGETIYELFKASMWHVITHHPQTVLRDHKSIFKAFSQKNPDKLNKAILKSFEGWKWGLEQDRKQVP